MVRILGESVVKFLTSELSMRLQTCFILIAVSAFVVAGCAASSNALKVVAHPISSLKARNKSVSDEAVARSEFAVASARLAEDQGDVGKAKQMLLEAIEINPQSVDAHWRQAILLAKQDDLEESTTAFEKAIELDENNPGLCADFGYHLYLQGDLERAEKFLRLAVLSVPDNKRAWNNLGLVLAAMGKNDEAIAAFLDAGISEAQARSNLALAQSIRHDLDGARESYRASLSLDPTNQAAASALRQLARYGSRTPDGDEIVASASPQTIATGTRSVVPVSFTAESGRADLNAETDVDQDEHRDNSDPIGRGPEAR